MHFFTGWIHCSAGVLIPTDIKALPSVHWTLPNRCWNNGISLHICFCFPPLTLFLFTVWRNFDRIAPATGKQEKQMGPELMDVDGYCFLLISIGWGAGDRESPLIGAGYRLARGGAAAGVRKGSSVQAGKSWNVARWRGKAQPWSLTPVINVWNAVNFSLDGKGLLQSQHFACIREWSHIYEHSKD